MKTKTYGELQTANEYLDDSDTLNSAFDQRGYLFLRCRDRAWSSETGLFRPYLDWKGPGRAR